MPSLLHLIAIGVACLTLRWEVAADATTNATCVMATWTYNQEQQTPCLVASVLQSACNGGTWSVSLLPSGGAYAGPHIGQSNRCQCSTVVYSLLSACGYCQGDHFTTWSVWNTNCTPSDISISSFPLAIPDTTTVPSWAYLDVTANGVWDMTASFNTHNSGAQDSSGIGPTSTIASSATTPATSSNFPSTTSSSNSSNAGAIAGGVVGGVVLLALLGIVGYIVIRRRRTRASYSPSTKSLNGEKVDLVGPSSPPPSTPLPVYPVQPLPKFYDPDDPSTFPPTPSPSFFPSMSSPTFSSEFSPTSGSYIQVGSQSLVSPGESSFVGSQLSDPPRALVV